VSNPFIQLGYLYATDGRIAVRTKQPKGTPDTVPPEGRKFPDVGKEFARFWPGASEVRQGSKPWPQLPATNICKRCTEEPVNPKAADTRCQFCLGYRMVPAHTEVAGRRISGWYWSLIRSLSGVRYSTHGGPEDPVCFVADGGIEGLMMPRVNS
jgi:hypothetical protein